MTHATWVWIFLQHFLVFSISIRWHLQDWRAPKKQNYFSGSLLLPGAMQVQNSTLHQQHLHVIVTAKGHHMSFPCRHLQTWSKAEFLLQNRFQNYEKKPTYKKKQRSLVTIFGLNIFKHFSTKHSQTHIAWTSTPLKSCLWAAVLNSLLISQAPVPPPSQHTSDGVQAVSWALSQGCS